MREKQRKNPKRDLLADGFDFLYKLPAHLVQQVRIGGIRGILRLGRGVHRHAFGLDQPQLAPPFQNDALNGGHSLGADALAKFGHAGAVKNLRRLRLIKSAKVLPVDVLMEVVRRLLVRDVVAVLEDMKTYHEPDEIGPSSSDAVIIAQLVVNLLPGDEPGRAHQLVLRVQKLVKLFSKHGHLPFFNGETHEKAV